MNREFKLCQVYMHVHVFDHQTLLIVISKVKQSTNIPSPEVKVVHVTIVICIVTNVMF